jgi:carboxyl-terminal processing protease
MVAALAVAAGVGWGGFQAGFRNLPPSPAAPVRVAGVGLLPDTVPAPSAFPKADPSRQLPPEETYADALAAIHGRFYGALPKSPDYSADQVLTYAAIRGMLASLGDRYTRFLTPDEYKDMMDENRGEFSGIGAHLDAKAKDVVIVDTIEGSPARKAGLKPGDRITKVDNRVVAGMRVDDAVKLIRGERGTPVRLTIVRKDVTKPFVVTVVRDIVELEPVKTEVLPGNIGYMSLSSFNDQSDHMIEQALAKLQAKNVKGLVLDLRWNPGGLLDQAVAIASRFIPKGSPVVWIKERGGRPEALRTVRVKRRVGDIPVAVLVNKYSASASEIVSGAIKDTKSGTLVGVTTWGKGLVQTINPIPTDNSAVLITTHRYYTPNMVDINKKGIVPDVIVDVADKDFAAYQKSHKLTDDPQVKKAISVVESQIARRTAQR